MEKIFTSLKLPGIFILLTSALASYWNYPALETYEYPKDQAELHLKWFESPMGIFSLNYIESSQNPTISAPTDLSVKTDTGTCTASIAIDEATFTGESLSWEMTGATTGTGNGQVGTHSFKIGTTTIIFTATGEATSVTDSMDVVVTDEEDPKISLGNAISEITDAGQCTASIAIPDATFSDNCSGSSISWSIAGATTGSGNGQIGTQTFNIGTSTISYTVTDAANNTISQTLAVEVKDEEDPKISLGNAISQTTDAGQCTASIAIPDATFSDNCSGSSLSWSITGATTGSGNGQVGTQTFKIGTSTITYTVTDAANNTVSQTLAVEVTDEEDPKISLGSAISETTDAGQCTASIVLPDATFSDNCSGSSISWSIAGATTGSGNGQIGTHTFNIGTSTITYTVTDAANNTISQTLAVEVKDEEDPKISLGNAISEITDSGQCTASIAIPDANFSDNCSGSSISWSVTGATTGSGNGQVGTHTFNIGTSTITYTVTDAANNTVSQTLAVEVTDEEDPKISLGSAISETTDSGQCTASIAIPNATFSDNCSGSSISWSITGATTGSGNGQIGTQTFNIGTSTITYTVTDAANNTISQTLAVEVTDEEDPKISLGNAISEITDSGQCTASIAIPNATFSDNCSGSSISWSIAGATTGSGNGQIGNHTFNIGTSTITYMVTDAANNTVSQTLAVEVTDEEDPKISLGSAISETTDAGQCTASIAIPDAIFSDNCSGSSLSWSIAGATTGSGTGQIGNSNFNIGKSTITYTVVDASGNTATASLDITISDQEKPVITAAADISVPNTAGQCYAGVSVPQATASDNCSVGTPTGTRDDGQPLNTTYPVGTTTITWNVTDANGNAAEPVVQKITVEDKEAPEAPQLEDILWGCEYTFEAPTTSDNCDNVITATTNQSLTFTTSGAITWIFKDSAGNTTTATQKITIDPVEIAPVEVVHVLCNGNATGAITVEASGGVAPYTYDWGSLGAGDTKTDLSAGTYSVKAFDANGCETETLQITINEPATFIEVVNVKTTSGCYGQNNGTAYAEAKGGTPGYTFKWSNGQTTQTATGLPPGNHSVTITDANGCSAQRTVTVSQPTELKITGFLTTETTSYGTATGTATVQITGGTPNYSFKWSNNLTGQTAQGLAAGTYSVTVTDANGCTATKEVTIVDSLEANIVPISICETGSVIRTSYFEVENRTARGGTPPYSYSWNFGKDATPATAVGEGRHTVHYSSAEEKLITLTVTDAKGRTFTQSVIQNVAGCFSDTCGSNDLGLDNYFIGDSNQNPITSSNCSSVPEKFIYIDFPTNSERYSLYIELIYSVKKINSETTQHYKVEGCFFQKQAIPDIAKTFAIDYECGDAVKIEGIYLTFQNNVNRECGATQGNGNHPKCYSTNNEATVTSPLYAVAFPNELLCNGGETGIINARASGGSGNYTYKLISAVDQSVIRTSQPSNSFTGLPAGRYKVIVNDGNEDFTTAEVEIKQPANTLALEITAQTEITCFGGSDGTATVLATGGTPNVTGDPYIYIWEGIGQTTATATNLSAGTYLVRVLDANGCEAFIDVEIAQPAEIPANAGPDQVLECGNLTTFLAAVFDPVVTEGEPEPQGTWSIVNGPAGGVIENVNDPNSRFSGNVGTYTLRWTVPCGASDDVKISLSSCSTLDFDGVNDHVVIGDKFDLPSSGFTIEAWVKQDPGKTSGIKTVLSKRDNSALASGGFDLIVENNIPKFRWNGTDIASQYTIGTDRWYHLAVIVGGDDEGLYVDGIKTSTGAPGVPTSISAPVIIGASANSATSAPENYFHGWIEELRIWKKPLLLNQVKFLMNQRLKVGSSPLRGMILPMDAPGPLNFDQDLIAYYQLIVAEITNGTTLDKAPNAYHGKMVNIKTLQENTAPLPYYSAKDGQWIADNTWLRPAVWDHPNSRGVDGASMIDWNIVVTKHNITSQAKDIRVLGLLSETETKRLTIANPSGPQNETNSGQSLSISHYLLLNGVIDLMGESQLLQDTGSILDATSKGYLERDQQGTASSYTYNYWTSPVSPGINANYSVKGTMKDGTITTFRELVFGTQYHFADGNYSDPRKISNYWLHKFHGTANNYFSWEHIGHTGTMAVGEGYSMKGTSGWAGNTDLQNYTFVGLPNNGEISLNINTTSEGENYLVGNPYPSSIDANKFIEDNVIASNPANSAFNGTLYFWDHFAKTDHYLEHYIGGYAAFNLGGSVEPASSVDSRIDNSDPSRTGSKRPGNFIPVGQAFFVNTVINPGEDVLQTTGRKTLVFNNGQRTYKREGIDKANGRDDVIFFGSDKKAKSTNKASEERQRIWLKFQSPKGYHRQILVTADARTSNGFDLGFDAPLIDNNIEDMYWLMNEQVELVIQGVPDFNADRVLPLGLKTADGGKFVIKIDELENIGDEFAIFVKDSQTNTYFNLRDGDFTATIEKGNIHQRYSIVFSIDEDPETGEETPGEGGEDGSGEDGEDEDGNDGDGDNGNGEGDGDGDGTDITKPDQPQPTPPADIELLYSNREGHVIIKNSGMLPLKKAVLYNSLGQELVTFGNLPVQNFTELPIEVPSTGVYYIKVHLKDTSRSLKFIVE